MKKTIFTAGIAILLAISVKAQTATNIVAWTFENDPVLAPTTNPVPSTFNGLGTEFAAALGMNTNYPTPSPGTNDPDVLAGKGSDTGANGIADTSHEWRIRAQNSAGTANGWSTNAPIGTQGAEFAVDTTGFNFITVRFDWYATSQGEGNLELIYTDDGSNWINVPINVPAAESELASNYNNGSDANTVTGYYVSDNILSNSLDGQDWFTNLTATITNDPGAGNNPNFAIAIVNASTLSDCVNAQGTLLNNSSGNWRFDNVAISGIPVPRPFVKWNFEGVPQVITPDPTPSLNGSVGAVSAACIGMTLFGGGTTNSPDVTHGVAGDTGSDGITNYTQIWRIRGAAGNGWTSAAGIGTQGAQFNADTTGYTNILVGFDWYLTTQGEGHLQLEYTVDGINWVNLPIIIPAAQAGTSLNFVDNTADGDAYSVQGYYVDAVPGNGQNWFTNLTAVITNPAAANNPNFGVRMVNASTGSSCVNGSGAGLNNSSGNWRFDNVYIAGLASAALLAPPVITPASAATVDGPFTNTFTDNPGWRTNISSITVNGTILTNSAYVISAGQIVFTPSASTLLQTAGSVTIAISATNYNTAAVVQNIAPGAARKLIISTQPVAPTGNGGTLVTQPALAIYDQYNNVATNGTATFTATPSAGWTFGPGSAPVQTLANGVLTFTNLSAISPAAVSGATITFTASGVTNLPLAYLTTNSAAFTIPAPATTGFTPGNLAVEQEDVASKNSTFSILELSPTISNQSTPVNTFPIPATGTNALRQSSSGSTGRVADSDDGTLLCFSAALCGDSTVADATTVDPRGGGTFNAEGQYALPATYIGAGDATANQARSSVTVDDVTYFMGDKGGIYTNGDTPLDAYVPYSTSNPANVRSLKSFGKVVFALQQAGGTDPLSVVLNIVPSPATGLQFVQPLEGFSSNLTVLDFTMMRSGNNGTNYDTAYYIDGTNTTSGAIYKFFFTGQYDGNTGQPIWQNAGSTYATADGSWPTPNGGDGLCGATNVNGGVDLYYTTGSGGSTGNSVIHVYDSAGWNQPINITATNLLYTVAAQATLKGIAFAPLAVAGAPTVTTLPASQLTLSGATVNATVNPNDNPTAYWFTYGPVGSETNVTVTNMLAAGNSPVNVNGALSGLAPGFYQYQIVASNSVATVSGLSMVFATLAVTPPNLSKALLLNAGALSLTFTNVPGASFTLWGSTNLPGQWQNLGHPTESPAGTYSFSGLEATNPAEFYRVTSP